jgi:hypothetical protein
MSKFGKLQNCKVIKKIGLLYLENFKIWGFLTILVNYLVKNHHIRGFFTIKVTYLVKNVQILTFSESQSHQKDWNRTS